MSEAADVAHELNLSEHLQVRDDRRRDHLNALPVRDADLGTISASQIREKRVIRSFRIPDQTPRMRRWCGKLRTTFLERMAL